MWQSRVDQGWPLGVRVTTPGYAHRGQVLRLGPVADTYYVEIPALAPDRAYGPVPSTVPGLAEGDRVLLQQIGMTRGDVVITGKMPPTPFDSILPIEISDVTGLSAALADKADDSEITTINGTLASHTGSIATNATAIANEITNRGTAVTAEATARASADTTLNGLITAEAATRASADTTEATARAAISTLLGNTIAGGGISDLPTFKTAQDSYARGFIGELKRTTADLGIGATETFMEALTVTLVSGRRYRVSWDVVYDTSTNGTPFPFVNIRYKAGSSVDATGTLIQGKNINALAVGASLTYIGTFVAPSSGLFTIGTSASRSTGTVNFRYTAGSTTRLLLIEDIGV